MGRSKLNLAARTQVLFGIGRFKILHLRIDKIGTSLTLMSEITWQAYCTLPLLFQENELFVHTPGKLKTQIICGGEGGGSANCEKNMRVKGGHRQCTSDRSLAEFQ